MAAGELNPLIVSDVVGHNRRYRRYSVDYRVSTEYATGGLAATRPAVSLKAILAASGRR